MTPAGLANSVRFKSKTTSTTFSDADILAIANPAKDELCALIAERDIKGNYFILPALSDLTAGQREYAVPDDVLNSIYSVEFAFSNTADAFSQLSYILSLPDDFRRWRVSRSEANIQAHYSNGAGRVCHEIQRRSLYLLSGPVDATTLGASTITNGIRLRYRVYPADLTDLTLSATDMSVDPTTTSFGVPKQFHELWARRISIEWKGSRPKPIPLSPLEQKYEADLEKMLQAISDHDMSGEVIGTIPSDDGQDL